ncbi:hypothetical protein EJA70_22555 [Pseudomonas sp. PB103]|nr:hypothetical protein EJA70_22555 [Pseudomonas sp. PB103]
MFLDRPATPCRSCRRLRSFDLDLKKRDQKIAACGSSYRGSVVSVRRIARRRSRRPRPTGS